VAVGGNGVSVGVAVASTTVHVWSAGIGSTTRCCLIPCTSKV
jgi:hypothetical protein